MAEVQITPGWVGGSGGGGDNRLPAKLVANTSCGIPSGTG